MRWFILRDRTIVVEVDEDTHSEWMLNIENRRILHTTANGILVSTIFLGIDMGIIENDSPLVFETMIFDGTDSSIRRATLSDALADHAAFVTSIYTEAEAVPNEPVPEPEPKQFISLKTKRRITLCRPRK